MFVVTFPAAIQLDRFLDKDVNGDLWGVVEAVFGKKKVRLMWLLYVPRMTANMNSKVKLSSINKELCDTSWHIIDRGSVVLLNRS